MVRPAGIQRAKRLGLVSSGVAGAIFSPYIKETTSLFDRKEKGRLFTMIRAPVYRIVSKYYYMKDQGLLHYDNSTVTMEQFIASDDDNWMVRALSSSPRSRIGERELNIAKEVLRKHVLVGLWEEKAESLRRIEQYFGWELPSPVAEQKQNIALSSKTLSSEQIKCSLVFRSDLLAPADVIVIVPRAYFLSSD